MEENQKEKQNEKTILVRFNTKEFELIERARSCRGIRSRGNYLRSVVLPSTKKILQEEDFFSE